MSAWVLSNMFSNNGFLLNTLQLLSTSTNSGTGSIRQIPWTYYHCHDLERDQHVSEISCKATKTMGFLRRHLAHTKHWFILSSSMQLLFGIPINETETKKRWRKCRRQQPGEPAGDGGTGVASTICWTNSSGGPQGEVLLNLIKLKRNNRDFLCYFLSINVQFLHGLHPSIFQ